MAMDFRTEDLGLGTKDYGLWTADCGLRFREVPSPESEVPQKYEVKNV